MSRNFNNLDGDRVDLGDIFAFDRDVSWTCATFVRFLTDLTTDERALITKWDVGDSARRQFMLNTLKTAAHKFVVTSGADTVITGGATITTDTWYLVGVTCDGAGTLRLFSLTMDGTVLDDAVSGTAATDATNNTADVELGGRMNGGNNHDGDLAYNGCFTSQWVLQDFKDYLYRSSLIAAKFSASKVYYLPLIGKSPEPDWSGNGNSGTVSGTTITDMPPTSPLFGFDPEWQGAFTAAAAGNIDTQAKRMCAAGAGRPFMRANFPVAAKDAAWRMSVGNAYCGNLLTAGLFPLDVAVGSYAITGVSAANVADYKDDATPGSYAITGIAASIDIGLDVTTGVYSITGISALNVADYKDDATPGSYVITGISVDLVKSFLLDVDVGSYALTGISAGLVADYVTDATPGVYNITGISVSIDIGLDVVTGSYAVTGVSANLIRDGAILATTGSYSITGISAANVADFVENVTTGSYVITGTSADLLKEFILDASPGSYLISGISASLITDSVLDVTTGSYTVTGISAAIVADIILDVTPGSYVITGISALTVADRVLLAITGSYVITGVAADLVFSAVSVTDFPLLAATGSYVITGISIDALADLDSTEYAIDPDPVSGAAVIEALIQESRFYLNVGVFKSPDDIWMVDLSDYNQDGKLVRDPTDLIIRIDDDRTVGGLAVRVEGKVVEMTDEAEHVPHPLIFSAFNVMFVKQTPSGVWVIDDSDDEPEPRQAGLVLTSGFYHIDPGPEIPRGLSMSIVDKLVSLST